MWNLFRNDQLNTDGGFHAQKSWVQKGQSQFGNTTWGGRVISGPDSMLKLRH